MPFELGLAYSIARRQAHGFFVFEERSYRLQASLSDFNGTIRTFIEGTQDGILRVFWTASGRRVVSNLLLRH